MAQSFAEALSWVPKSRNLAMTLARALDYAKAQSHRVVTLEHLLLALISDSDASVVLQACRVDLSRLNGDIGAHLSAAPERASPGEPYDPAAASDLLRILEYASAAAQQSRRKEINGAIVLAAIVGDGRSPAAGMLRAQGLTFEETIKALQRAGAAARNPAPLPAEPGPPPEPPLQQIQQPSAPAGHARETATHPAAPAPRPPWQGEGSVPGAEPLPRHVNGAMSQSTEDILAAARQRVGAGRSAGATPPTHSLEPAADPGRLEAHIGAEPREPEPPLASPHHGEPPGAAMPDAFRDQGFAAPTPPPQPPPPEAYRPAPPAAPEWTHLPPHPRHDTFGTGEPQAPPYPPPPATRAGPSPARPAPQATAPPFRGPPQRPAPAPWAEPPPHPNVGAADPGIRGRPVAAGAPYPHAGGVRAPPPVRSAPAGPPPSRESRPGATVATGQLIENIPRRMRVGTSETVEVRIAKADVSALADGLQGAGMAYRHDLVVTKAMAVKLRAPAGGFWIETASPETQWIENSLGSLTDDYASWRWTVTPQRRGKARLQLVISARTIGADGLVAETALPDQVIEVKIRTNVAHTAAKLGGWILAGIAGGFLARFGEGLWALAQSILAR